MKTRILDRGIILTSLIGVLVSTYALYVEMAAEIHPGYEAMCDISEYASCSRVLTSEYSKGFGILSKESLFTAPNCIYGIVFYCIVIFLSTFDSLPVVCLQLYLTLSAVASCVYLAYLLAFVLRDICIVCISTYFINASLLILINKKKVILTAKAK